jgi:hypothetical protein
VNDLLVDAIAAYRLTHLVTTDRITRRFRVWVAKREYGDLARQHAPHEPMADVLGGSDAWWDERPTIDADPPLGSEFVHCPWCVGMWIALGITAARRYADQAWEPLARALVVSAVAGFLSGHDH